MTPPSKSPSSTSTAAIIEGIKHGNTLGLQLIKQMRDGLDMIAEGMQRECYNRNDACDELSESMKSMSSDCTNTRKLQLIAMIKAGMRACDDTKAEAHAIKKAVQTIARENHDAILEARIENRYRLKARERSLKRLQLSVKEMINAVPGDTAMVEILQKSTDDLERNWSWWEEDVKMHKVTMKDAQKNLVKEENKAETISSETCAFADKMQLLLLEMALALGFQLL